jgi:hypothetical protein
VIDTCSRFRGGSGSSRSGRFTRSAYFTVGWVGPQPVIQPAASDVTTEVPGLRAFGTNPTFSDSGLPKSCFSV